MHLHGDGFEVRGLDAESGFALLEVAAENEVFDSLQPSPTRAVLVAFESTSLQSFPSGSQPCMAIPSKVEFFARVPLVEP